jgi:SMODS and SLOG-associating 2TM effector domain
LTTLVASYLARMRGSSEPDQSIKRTDRLDHLIRAIYAFKLDYSRKSATEQETKLEEFRYRFEDIMRNPNHAATATAGANATPVADADEKG